MYFYILHFLKDQSFFNSSVFVKKKLAFDFCWVKIYLVQLKVKVSHKSCPFK